MTRDVRKEFCPLNYTGMSKTTCCLWDTITSLNETPKKEPVPGSCKKPSQDQKHAELKAELERSYNCMKSTYVGEKLPEA